MRFRLIVMNFLQYAVWGAYLISMGAYLARQGMATQIGWFYAIQGVVSLFMPAIIGIIADRWVQAQRMLGICHLIAAAFMCAAGVYGITAGSEAEFSTLFTFYAISVAFYMPTIALSNSVAYSSLETKGLDVVKSFPPIRVFGTVGFIFAEVAVNFLCINSNGWLGISTESPERFQYTAYQFIFSAVLGLILGIYSFTLPQCKIDKTNDKKSLVDALGLKAFALFKQKKMALFFIFSMLLGISLQITNAFANPFITEYINVRQYWDSFGAHNANVLISISQISETLCILLIPFFLKRFGIKRVMIMAMFAWVLRFALFGFGNPGSGVWMFILSCVVYGIAFDFFNISGSLFVNNETDSKIRSSAQGLFMIMTNGIGATIGTLGAQAIVNKYVYSQPRVFETVDVNGVAHEFFTPDSANAIIGGWEHSWLIFAGYALVVTVLFAIFFKYKHDPNAVQEVSH